MLTVYGKAAFNTRGRLHLVMQRKTDDGHIKKRVACNTPHKDWEVYGDEWSSKEYKAMDMVLKSGHACRKCRKLIQENASCF